MLKYTFSLYFTSINFKTHILTYPENFLTGSMCAGSSVGDRKASLAEWKVGEVSLLKLKGVVQVLAREQYPTPSYANISINIS
jgi:hypothetical protein